MNYIVSSKSLGKITLNETDPAASILQNIAIFLKTWQQSVPLYRSFGLSKRFVDKPIPVAMSLLVAEITEALPKFEPRATLKNVTFEADSDHPGKMIPTVEVEINE